jgi:hypothetical protein
LQEIDQLRLEKDQEITDVKARIAKDANTNIEQKKKEHD